MDSIDAIEALVTERIGLVIRDKDRQNFEQTIAARLKVKQQTGAEYLRFLRTHDLADEEWDKLHFSLTVGESYFFRDRGQMDLLRDVVFPALIRENGPSKQLRIWSAGCSTGEEPYSLAMLLDMLLPDRDEWNVEILATDINKHALEKARLGVYSDWSFRKMEPAWRDRYFTSSEYEWQLDRRIRKMVRFRSGNLALDPLPDASAGMADLDFIFCRNVFIYFSRDTVERIAERMGRALRPGGYFMAGHGELFNLSLPELRVEMHPNSVIYRRLDGPARSPAAPAKSRTVEPGRPPEEKSTVSERLFGPPEPLPAPTHPGTRPGSPLPKTRPQTNSQASTKAEEPAELSPAKSPPPVREGASSPPQPAGTDQDELALLEEMLRQHRYNDLIHRAGPPGKRKGSDPVLYLLARALANLGDHPGALLVCEQALEADRTWTDVMLLQAQIIEESGRPDRALEILRRVLYLEPENVKAYLEMAEVYVHQGQSERARKQQETALSILKKLNSGTEIDRYEGITVGDLTRDLEGHLARNHE